MRNSVAVILIAFLLLVNQNATAQTSKNDSTYSRVLTYYELWEEIFECNDSVYDLDNALVIQEIVNDSKVLELFNRNKLVRPRVRLSSVKFKAQFPPISNSLAEIINLGNVRIYLSQIEFQRGFTLWFCDGIQFFEARRVKFNGGLSLINPTGIWDINISDCVIKDQFEINVSANEKDNLALQNRFIKLENSRIELANSNRPIRGIAYFDVDNETNKVETLRNPSIRVDSPTDLYISKCVFDSDSSINWFELKGEFKSLSIDSTDFKMDLEANQCSFEDKIAITNSLFKGVSFWSAKYPDIQNINMRWSQLTEGLSIIQHDMKRKDSVALQWIESKLKYTGTEDVQVGLLKYDDLIAMYQHFQRIYRERGDIESANGCRVGMKDIQTEMLRKQYEMDDNLETWLYWKLNVFLKFFAKYGTSPVRAIIVSLWTIFLFSIIYFFFYSEWDKINRAFLIRKYRNTVRYFRSEQKLEDFYSEQYKEDLKEYEEFKKEISDSKVEVPFFITLLGKPLFRLSMFQHTVMRWLYRKTEVLSGRWVNLSPKRKFFVGSTVGFFILLYLLNLVMVRSLNSLMLSLNAFSTLGFGEIPVKGLSRYIAIIEGFLGWFLLSIFSVSLISQIMMS